MKAIILLALIVSPSAFAKTELASSKTSLRDAAKTAGSLNEIVSTATTPGSGCTEEQVHLPRQVLKPDPLVPLIVCRPDATSLTAASTENYSQLIRDYNIEFHPNEAAIIGTRDWRLFVHELRKFPPALMQEMASAGGKIRVMIGNGVSEDPQWEQERLRSLRMNEAYRNWYNGLKPDKRVGVSPPSTDEEINRGFLTTTEGSRQWDTVSGAGGVFSNPAAISPTRIVLNRMYISAYRQPDGKIGDAMQGSTNLFLHEHGHALDNLYRPHSVSGSDAWKNVLRDPQVQAYAEKIFSTYENGFAEEGFAEAFAYYHSCEASRKQMETQAPALANFFQGFTSMAPYK